MLGMSREGAIARMWHHMRLSLSVVATGLWHHPAGRRQHGAAVGEPAAAARRGKPGIALILPPTAQGNAG
jgi:hypothetical protein